MSVNLAGILLIVPTKARGLSNLKAVAVALAGSLISILLFRLPFWSGPMYGDDYLLVNGAHQPVDSSGIIGDFFLVGGGKWRPLNTPLLLFLARRFGFSYRPYQIVNLALLVMCCTVVGLMVWIVCRTLLVTLLSSVCIGASCFTWLGQISVYGVLEFSAVLIALLAVAVELHSSVRGDAEGKKIYAAVGLVLSATFIHERMLILAFLFGAFHLLKRRRLSLALTYFSIPMIHVVLKGFFFQLDAAQTGGESNLQQVKGLWIIRHLIDGVGAILGMNSGSGVFYSDGTISRFARSADLGFIGASPVILVALLVMVIGFGKSRSSRFYEWMAVPSLLLALAIGALIPASLVIQRIEGRWLFFPQALLVVGLFTWVGTLSLSGKLAALRLCLIGLLTVAFLCPSIYYRTKSGSFTFIRDQPSLMIADVFAKAPVKGPWVLVLGSSDPASPFQWQMGYTRAFEQLPNPPIKTVWGNDHQDCPRMSRPLPCLIAIAANGSLRSRVEILYVAPSEEPADRNGSDHQGGKT